MAKVTIKKVQDATPSDVLVEKAQQAITITDKRGRIIGLRDPGILAEFELIRIVGGEAAENGPYMQMLNFVTYVHEIDGEPVLPLINKLRIDALIQQLGRQAVNLVMEAVLKQFGEQDAAGDKAAIKK